MASVGHAGFKKSEIGREFDGSFPFYLVCGCLSEQTPRLPVAAAPEAANPGRVVREVEDMDTNELCCGKLFYAELVDDVMVLECCTCGKHWQAQSKGGFIPLDKGDGIGSSVGRGGQSAASFAESDA